jgi:hypothetical protein
MNTESSKKFEQSAALTPELPTPLAGRALRRVREKWRAGRRRRLAPFMKHSESLKVIFLGDFFLSVTDVAGVVS